jgi:gamma-glutamyltranspeptidase/glutathione hydrolase
MAVSIIQSNYRGTGSPFGAARSGFLLQDRGAGFSLTPGHPNELAPGKRPLHTLAPTLWTEGTNPSWLLGTRGGSVQPQLVAQVGVEAILGGTDLETAQSAPRWTISDFGPCSESRLTVESGMSDAILTDLRSRGHVIEELDAMQPGWGPLSLIELEGDTRRSAADPRVDTTAAFLF